MDTKVQIQATDVERAPQVAPKPAWHTSVITRIDIKRTMNGSKLVVDGPTGSVPE